MDKNKYEIIRLGMERTAENLRKNNFYAECAENREEACEIVRGLISEEMMISVGGSVTLFETGIIDMLKNGNYNYLDRYAGNLSFEETKEIFRKSFYCDAYLCSANAITERGELYCVDGNGNRAAAMIYGPDSVIVIAGYNKIVKDINEAETRLKLMAAPANAVRLHKNTPCAVIGRCVNCSSEDRICSDYVVFSRQQKKDRIKVILVGEELGY